MRFEWTKPPHLYDVWWTEIFGVKYSVGVDQVNNAVFVYCSGRKLSQEFHSVDVAINFVECNWRILNDSI